MPIELAILVVPLAILLAIIPMRLWLRRLSLNRRKPIKLTDDTEPVSKKIALDAGTVTDLDGDG